MARNLKLCPFCGGRGEELEDNAVTFHGDPDHFYVQCENCAGASGYRSSPVWARAAWNRRAVLEGKS